jgi:hypothetical protein
LANHYFNPFRVKVINSSHPLAHAALDARDRFPAQGDCAMMGDLRRS